MNSKLDLIESRLQALIEQNLSQLFAGNPDLPVTHLLVQAMLSGIVQNEQDESVAPDIYTIYLHPENFIFWKDNQEMLDAMADALKTSALENGLIFKNDPVLRVSIRANLKVDEVFIAVSFAQSPVDHTAVMASIPDESPEVALPTRPYLIVNGSQTFCLDETIINIGRREDNHLVILDPRVSRNHAQLRALHGHYVIFDLNSTGGTFVNGQRISQYSLKAGDVISLAGVSLVYGEDETGGTYPLKNG